LALWRPVRIMHPGAIRVLGSALRERGGAVKFILKFLPVDKHLTSAGKILY
jgi:hypothetical protein